MAYEEKQEGEKPKEKSEDEEILGDVRTYLKECIEEEDEERGKMLDDLRFCTLDQWPSEIRSERENDIENGPRPCLTIDKINQYIVQILNDTRQGKPGINVRPQDSAADIETAKILKGVVRNIEDQSSADIAYTTAIESAIKVGLGYFRITTEYVSDDSFDQEIFIRSIPNTFSVYLGKHILPDGSDAERGYIVEQIPVTKFKELFPKAKCESKDFDGIDAAVLGYWRTTETITVVEEFCFKRDNYELYFLADGTTISADDYAKWPEAAGPKPEIQDKRMTSRKQLKWRKVTGVEVLEQRDLPGKYIPIVEVVGRESWVEGRRHVWGLVRPAKDSLRMYNYWASTITERMGLAPKQPYIAAEGQIEGREQEWKTANKSNRSVLLYKAVDVNGNALPAPKREGPIQMEAALLQQMQVIEHDVQTSLGMFKASVGETESQQSGRAILALQRESDTGTYHFGANLGISIRHAGRIVVDMVPHYYDTKRVLRIIGEDGEIQSVQIDPEQEESHRKVQTADGMKSIYNPGVGKYDVSVTVGPSYNTKRMEAAATYVELSKGADPASAAVMHYLTVKNSDFSGADEAAKMLKALLPPAAQQAAASGQPIPPEAMAQIQKLTQAGQMMGEKLREVTEENQKLKAGEAVAMRKVAVSAQENQQKIEVDRQQAEREMAVAEWKQQQEARLAREKAAAEIQLARETAAAETQLEREKAEAKIALERSIAAAELQIERERLALEREKAEHAAKMAERQAQSKETAAAS